MATETNGLVDSEQGLVSRRIFIEPEIYERELKTLFARCWLFLCPDAQIPLPGDFFTTWMGEDPVLVVRDSAGHERHLILTDDRGGPMPRTLLPAVGRPVRASGSVNREGRLLFLRAAPGAVRVVER